MTNFIVYDSSTGRIIRLGYCADDDVAVQAQDGEVIMEGTADDSKQMVLNEQVVDRPALPFYLDRDSVVIGQKATFSSLPAGTTVDVDGDVVVVNDHVLALTFDTPGTYRVRLSLFPYLDREVTITCN
jgi:hypothetical protein